MGKSFRQMKRANAPFKSPVMKKRKSENRSEEENKKYEDLLKKEKELDEKIEEFKNRGIRVNELDEMIDLLHRYNDVKDVATAVLGILADRKQCTIRQMYEEFDMDIDD